MSALRSSVALHRETAPVSRNRKSPTAARSAMRIRIHQTLKEERIKQAGKITLLPGTGQLRPTLEILRFKDKTHYLVWAYCISKNAMSKRNHAIIVSSNHTKHRSASGETEQNPNTFALQEPTSTCLQRGKFNEELCFGSAHCHSNPQCSAHISILFHPHCPATRNTNS